MSRALSLSRVYGDEICLKIGKSNRNTRFYMSEEQALRLAYRLMAMANTQEGHEIVLWDTHS